MRTARAAHAISLPAISASTEYPTIAVRVPRVLATDSRELSTRGSIDRESDGSVIPVTST
jgi:hypothetical protein